MRPAKAGQERWVVRLMNQGKESEAIAYMKEKGMLGGFIGAPEDKPISSVTDDSGAIVTKPEEYKYPEFKPIRDPVPEGVKWARIKRELGHELQKIAILESDLKSEVLLWMSLREQMDAKARKGRLIGQAFAIEPNPEPRQAGWRIWRKS